MNKEIAKEELTPKNDIIFKRLFSKQHKEEMLKDFLEGILEVKINSIELRKRNTNTSRKD